MRFLLIGSDEDPHIHAVERTLNASGHEVSTWSSSEIPAGRSPTLNPTAFPGATLFDDEMFTPNLTWLRKRAAPDLDHTDPEYRGFIEAECRSAIDGILFTLEERAVMVNRASTGRRAASKILQLHAVAKMKFPIPRSLVTNDPGALRTFWRSTGRRLVYKPLARSYVDFDGQRLMLPTSVLKEEMLSDDELIRGLSGLYQQIIDKVEEVRITVFGEELIAVSLHGADSADVDWRVLFGTNDLIETTVPQRVREVCRFMMKFFDIEYAAFDFVIDEAGTWYFLEMNESGNFIFLDGKLPQLSILMRFCAFLVRRGSGAEGRLVPQV